MEESMSLRFDDLLAILVAPALDFLTEQSGIPEDALNMMLAEVANTALIHGDQRVGRSVALLLCAAGLIVSDADTAAGEDN